MQSKAGLRHLLVGGVSLAVLVAAAVSQCLKPAAKVVVQAKAEPTREWTLFGGTLQRNFVNLTARDVPDSFDVAKGTNILWSADPGDKAYGGPIVAGGKVYIGTNNNNPRDPAIKGDKGVLMCFDEKDGKFLWQLIFNKLEAGQVQDWPDEGICSSPFVEGDRLYFVSNRCTVVCADVNGDSDKPGKGKILWEYDMIGQDRVFPHNLSVCSPLVVGDLVFIVTANGVHKDHITVPSPEAPSFLCLNKKTGQRVWKNNNPSQSLVEAKKQGGNINIRGLVDQGKLLMHGQWSNPTYAEPTGKSPQIIFPGGDGWLYAFKPDSGELIWKFDCNPKKSFYVLGPRATRNDFIATPVVWKDKLYIAVGQDPEHKEGVGHLWCLDLTKDPKNADKDLTPAGDTFDPKDPKNKDSSLIWHFGGAAPPGGNRDYLFDRSMSTCAVHDGLCYAADYSGYVYCFDAITGQKYWEHETKASIWGSPYWVDGKVMVGTDDGILYIFKHGKEKADPQEIEMGGKVRATPIAANNTLFVLTESKTKLLAIRKK